MGHIFSGHVLDTGPGLVVASVGVNLICWQNSESAVVKFPVMNGAASGYEMSDGARNGNPRVESLGSGSRVSHCSGVAEDVSLMFLFLFV